MFKKRFICKYLIFLLCFIIFFFDSFIVKAQINDQQKIFEIFVRRKLKKSVGELIHEMEENYQKNKYEKVIEIVNQLPPFFPFTTKQNLIIADSYLKIANPQKAIEFSQRIISTKIPTTEYCIAHLIKAKALIILDKNKKALEVIKKLKKTFCKNIIQDEINILMYFLNQISKEKIQNIPSKKLKIFLGEIYKIKAIYLLNQKKPERAQKYIFAYINLYGDYKEGAPLIFKLAETYLKLHKLNIAQNFY